MDIDKGNAGGLKGEKSLNNLLWLLLTLLFLGALTLFIVPRMLAEPSRKPSRTNWRRRPALDFETAEELGSIVEDKTGYDGERSSFHFHPPLEGKLTALVRSPDSLYAYWECGAWPEGQQVLRLYQLVGDYPEKLLSSEILLYGETDNWIFRDLHSNTCYLVELGILSADGKYEFLLSSEKVLTPRDTLSSKIDPEWQPLAGLNFGFGANVQPLSSNSLRKE